MTIDMDFVHAPQAVMPQPNFVPVIPMCSRNTQSSGVPGRTSIFCVLPLRVKVTMRSLLKQGIGLVSRCAWIALDPNIGRRSGESDLRLSDEIVERWVRSRSGLRPGGGDFCWKAERCRRLHGPARQTADIAPSGGHYRGCDQLFATSALATTRVRSVPITGDRISMTSPTFKNRSGAEVRIRQERTRVGCRSGRRSVADDVTRIERQVARQAFEIFAERECHVACVVALVAARRSRESRDRCWSDPFRRRRCTDPGRGRAVEVLAECEAIMRCLIGARRANAPIREDASRPTRNSGAAPA